MSVKLNNDAVISVQSKNYRKATQILNRALLVSKYGSSCSSALDAPPSHSGWSSLENSRTCSTLEDEQEPYIEDDYDEGMDTFLEPCTIPPTKSNNSGFVKLVLFYNLGITHLKSSNNGDALSYFDKALSEHTALESLQNSGVPSICSFNTQETIALFHNLGNCYFRCHRFNDALVFYDKALDLSLQAYGFYHICVSMTLNCIGVVRLNSLDIDDDNKSTEDILGVFMEALAINEAISAKCQYEYQAENATILNNIGRVRFARKEYKEARAKYKESYRIRCCIYGPVHIDVAAVLYNIGEVQQMLENYEEAISLFQNFLDITVVKLGRKDFDTAVVYEKIGQILCDRDESDKAIEMYLKALDIVKSCLGETHTEVGPILNKIGNICYERQEYDIALKFYEEGLKLEKQIIDGNHANIVITTINIARIHHQLGYLDSALLLHEEALVIQREQCSTKADRLNMACTLSSIGLINDQRKQYWLAIDAFEEALTIRTDELGLTHFDISSTLNAIGLIRFKQGLLDLAINTFKESLEIRLNQDKPKSEDIAVVLFNIAAIYNEIGEVDKSIDFYQQTLFHESKASNKKKTDIVATLQRLAQIYEQLGKLDRALEYYEEAAVYCGINNPENRTTTQLSSLLNSIGTISLQRGDTNNAMEAFVKVTRINQVAEIDESINCFHNELDICDVIKSYSQSAAAA